MIAVMGDHDRDAILARRTLFISAALAGIACTSHEPPTTQSSTVSVEPREGETIEKNHERSGDWPSWAEIIAQAPPLAVPKGLTEREHELLSYLAEAQQRHYDALAPFWSAPPACGPSEADCAGWEDAVNAILDATYLRAPLCGYLPEITNTYLERQYAHSRYLGLLAEMLIEALDATVDARANPADSNAWEAQRQRLEQGRPQPCLSCMMPMATAITERISFEIGQATLPNTDSELQHASTIHQSNRGSRLIVRGHADPGEPDADALARKRAEAVAAHLIKLGVRRAELEIRSYGSSLPITNAPSEAALNCRVDFEVVPPKVK
jgi:outer membrane protein OmpA-like peptidoglycan-associated protein